MRKNNIIITVDYETWQPIPKGYHIDWKEDLINNTERLMCVCEAKGAKLTFMVEMCEYLWLCENDHEMALKVETQLKDIILRGHDIQLHLHPNWLPELGAEKNEEGWYWNWEYASAETYPGDFAELIQRCKERLEKILKGVAPDYSVKAYRAGAYRVQPFQKTADALKKNRIFCDTSVYRGGKSADRGYNFERCIYANKPYTADERDPQLEHHVNKEEWITELPITTWKKDRRWFLDNEEAEKFAKRFLYFPSSLFENENNFFVMIGHSKGKHDYDKIADQLEILKNYPNVNFTTIGESINEIRKTAKEAHWAEKSISEVKEIMDYLYNLVEPGTSNDYETPYGVLKDRRSLCYGYSVTLYQILKQYGYHVKCITAFADQMPKGRGKRKIDTHEIIELSFQGEKYILDPTVNSIKPISFRKLLRNPELASEKQYPDNRYRERDYQFYETDFFYRKVIYYYRMRPSEPILDGGLRPYMKRNMRVCLFHILPRKIKRYNIYRRK